MLNMELVMEIKIKYRQGESIKRIARDMGLSRNTVRRYLRSSDVPCCKRKRRGSKLDTYKEYIRLRVEAAYPQRIPATVFLAELHRQGYDGGITLIRNYIQSLLSRKQTPQEVIRYETPAGKQLQVDWATFRHGKDRLYGFVATLGYSRMSYVVFTTDMQIDTLLSCLEASFDYFGGVPERVLFDNMKTIVIERHAYGEGLHKFHKQLWDFAKHHRFLPRLCAPYRPQTKGKVERFISYLRHSFYLPLQTDLGFVGLSVDAKTANSYVTAWLHEVANARIHATTKEVPLYRWEADKANMRVYLPYAQLTKIADDTNEQTCKPVRQEEIDHTVVVLQHDLSIYQQLLT